MATSSQGTPYKGMHHGYKKPLFMGMLVLPLCCQCQGNRNPKHTAELGSIVASSAEN